MLDISAYKLTIIAAIVVLILSAAALTALSGASNTAQYVAFLGPTIVALLAVLRGEQNAKQSDAQHMENRAALTKLVTDNNTVAAALTKINSGEMTVKDAAQAAGDLMRATPATPPTAEEHTT